MISKIRTALIVILFTILVGGVGYEKGREVGRYGGVVQVKSEEKADMNLFWDVWERLESNYFDSSKISAKNMVLGAIKGMTASLDDPYTTFLPPTENTRSKEDLSGEFSGVGIQLGYIEKTLAVIAPIPDNPAIKAGILAGDLILKIVDKEKEVDKDTTGISLMEAMNLIRGKIGTEVTLTVLHKDALETTEITMMRDTINVVSVELKWVGNGNRIAHLRVFRFGDKTLAEWESAVGEILEKRRTGKFDGVIVDLRNNPGGYLKGAIDLASEFIDEGVVVQQQGKDDTRQFNVDRVGELVGVKLVVLVNGGSASASEILSGALRERVGAKLVGEKTFGKGTVQEASELPGGAGLHTTIAKWLLPSGKNIHDEGIMPDIEVKYEAKKDDPKYDNQLEKAIEVVK